MKMTRREFLKRGACAAAVTAGGAVAGGAAFLASPQFGRKPNQARIDRMLASPNFKDGAFRNYEPLSKGGGPQAKKSSRIKTMWKFLFGDKKAQFPPFALPCANTDISSIDINGEAFVWFGHSTIFLTLGSKRILIDPVFGTYASPVPFINRAFPHSRVYTPDDIPEIDLLLISHDHWDHLDYPTLEALRAKVKKVVTPLGVGEYLEQWGYDGHIISEGDWWDVISPFDGFEITILPARHFSGRLYRPNQTLWCGFSISAAGRTVVFSGDGGWGEHIKDIARRIGWPVDLAFLENGQYNAKWPNCHMHPKETARAAEVFGAKRVMPIHNSKFALSEHIWNAPLMELAEASIAKGYELLTPQIGREVMWSARDMDREGFDWYFATES